MKTRETRTMEEMLEFATIGSKWVEKFGHDKYTCKIDRLEKYSNSDVWVYFSGNGVDDHMPIDDFVDTWARYTGHFIMQGNVISELSTSNIIKFVCYPDAKQVLLIDSDETTFLMNFDELQQMINALQDNLNKVLEAK